mgnify:CR=1 FL=1
MNSIKELNKKIFSDMKLNSEIEKTSNNDKESSFIQTENDKIKLNSNNNNNNNKTINSSSFFLKNFIKNREKKNFRQKNQIKNASSFLETMDNVHFDKNLFDTLIKKSDNYNLETQRRGRRRSRFPDPQWDCAETQIGKIVRYLCEEEVSSSYQKYCKPIFEQINTLIESYLYHDNNIEICQNLHMCPVTVDI